jgi:hypothetical protein
LVIALDGFVPYDAKMLSTPRPLANAILGKIGKPDRRDTAACMAMDADFGGRGVYRREGGIIREPMPEVDPFQELERILCEQKDGR